MSYKLTFSGTNSTCRVNGNDVTFPYTLKNGDVILVNNNDDLDRSFTVNGETVPWNETLEYSNTDIAIVGTTSGSGPVPTINFTINYTEKVSIAVDLTTLTGWSSLSDGEHTITIKAKADGYRDSQTSEGVQVTKGSSGYTVTINYSGLSSNLCFYSLDNGSTWVDGYVAGQTQLVLNNVEQIKFKVQADYSHYCAITRQSGDSFNSLYASSGGSETSSNIALTQDMVVQFAAGTD